MRAMRKRTNIYLTAVYLFAGFALYVMFRYIILYVLRLNPSASDEFAFVRVFLSGPMLILLGLLLIVKFSGVHRFIGSLFTLAGFLWLVYLAKTIFEEAA